MVCTASLCGVSAGASEVHRPSEPMSIALDQSLVEAKSVFAGTAAGMLPEQLLSDACHGGASKENKTLTTNCSLRRSPAADSRRSRCSGR